ncbi:D-2-hydroxyacid dehydrogenase [Photobacterium japonica]|uniref:D-2-hydroxyacid dehydrogenase n=1 Tax=Photobacterium japonica TaxID=2910235 RepID=UPI003D124A21
MHEVMIVSRQQALYEDLLHQAQLPELSLTHDPQRASIILADPPAIIAKLGQFPRLRWLQSTYAGVDALIHPALRQDYCLTNIKGCFGPLIAEYVFGQLLNQTRHVATYHQQQQQQHWQPQPYRTIAGQRIVILGTGSIGSHLARVAHAFGMQVIGVNRTGTTAEPTFTRCYAINALPEALAQADVVVSVLPATSATHHLLNANSLAHCQDAMLFNVGRGNAVCEQGLLQAIEKGHIHHAFLDVFQQEPLPATHPFWRHPQISVTPHIAAESFPEQVMAIFADNYRRWHQGEPLLYQIDFARGY